MKIIFSIIGVLASVVLCFSLTGPAVVAEEADKQEIAINIMPEDVLFDVPNMKPGDWAPRTIVIQNNGEMGFEYFTTLRNDSGSEKLFNELVLEVSDGEGELYNGKLAEFNTLSPRFLEPSSEEELHFTVRFPAHLGNEFQGLAAQFSLIFSAKGEQSDTDEVISEGTIGSGDSYSAGGSRLPDTATNMFNLLLIGGLLLAAGVFLIVYNRKNVRKAEKL
ncbi:LPXTG cell wall anchor domain-containing protein [Virgibacillus sp. NKC19-16]|uniref:LPXTG cell wall anchor domain-containing protein n=1 Tax=Virgibacillus salidurans TaxID=2831673 RepID=UPI001F334BD5|nr:LPXTG cell wall anchor domain-containing protein [Virgibacillus sp. NKC19-16]UJL45359.1 LPXTG cell wall anchor domain-containing protein [Virgibacillus sp. NKC19-16]